MVAFRGYEQIVHFKDINEWEEFASTKTGAHYRKYKNTAVFLLDGDSSRKPDPTEEFTDNVLVYRNPTNSRALY